MRLNKNINGTLALPPLFNLLLYIFLLLCWWQWCNDFRSPASLILDLLPPPTPCCSERRVEAFLSGWHGFGRRCTRSSCTFLLAVSFTGPAIKIRWSPDTLLQIRRQASKTDAGTLFFNQAVLVQLTSRPAFLKLMAVIDTMGLKIINASDSRDKSRFKKVIFLCIKLLTLFCFGFFFTSASNMIHLSDLIHAHILPLQSCLQHKSCCVKMLTCAGQKGWRGSAVPA